MSLDVPLLDTPKRQSLQSQSTLIRAALKDFERTFAANNDGRKPSKDDIKADSDVAAKYKEYNKIRDVLAGKIEYSTLNVPPKSPPKRRKHERTDSGVSCTPKKRSHDATPRKLLQPSELDLYDAIGSTTPKPVLLHAIGPTPQRDGKVLGLFDMLSNSAHSSRPTSSSRKRKLDAMMEESPRKSALATVVQTPSRQRNLKKGDILEHLTGTPRDTPETGHRKLSKTPISEGRKFMLSQFFATPSTIRYSNIEGPQTKDQTPFRDRVLGLTPEAKPLQQASDATPAFLRRSTSFKDRLLSASQPLHVDGANVMSPPVARVGPPTLRHLRSVPKIFSDFGSRFSDVEEEDEHEDDLEALREMEDGYINVLVQDSQQQSISQASGEVVGGENESQPVQKAYKKRGQKRTTRRAIMRPAKGKSADAPKFVAAGSESEDEEDISQVNETQLNGQTSASHGPRAEELSEDDFHASDFDVSDVESELSKKPKSSTKHNTKSTDAKTKKPGTINPNAITHMNFRTLKIKNKNSKAKGRGRFGRGRR